MNKLISQFRINGKYIDTRNLKATNYKLYMDILSQTAYLPEKTPIRARLWHIENNETHIQKCKCGNILKWRGDAYAKSCSYKCAAKNLDAINKRKTTCMDKYGASSPLASPIIQDKAKATLISKYGVSHPGQIESGKAKSITTCLTRYGVENVSSIQSIKDKKTKKAQDVFGVEHVFQSPIIKQRIKDANLTKFGVENVSQCDEIKEQKKDTSIKNRGSEYHTNAHINKETKDILTNYDIMVKLHHEDSLSLSEISSLYKRCCVCRLSAFFVPDKTIKNL